MLKARHCCVIGSIVTGFCEICHARVIKNIILSGKPLNIFEVKINIIRFKIVSFTFTAPAFNVLDKRLAFVYFLVLRFEALPYSNNFVKFSDFHV